jgi:hypothetical protein
MRNFGIATFAFLFAVSGNADADTVWRACNVKVLCPNVTPGGGRILDCLKDHIDTLQQPCLSAIGLTTLVNHRKAHANPGPATPSGGAPDTGENGN